MRLKILLCFTMITTTSLSADAAEIHLRTTCLCRDAIVRLGHVADVRDDDPARAKELASTELFPAPSRSKTLKLRELQELLSLAAIDVKACQFSGAGVVVIEGNSTPPARHAEIPKATLQRARTRVEQAIASHLKHSVDAKIPWEVKIDLDERQAQAVIAKDAELAVAGGHEPWTGRQEFAVTVKSAAGQTRFTVVAAVSLPPLVAVVSRPLRKGEVVRASDIKFLPAVGQVQNAIYRIEEVLGKETTRAVAAGQILDAGHVRSPLLVQRGEVVRVIARAAGVRIRTTARALQEGSHGELVEVQALEGKQRYTARVVDYQEVEVYAQGPSVSAGK